MKKSIEPFNLFGENSLILTKEEANKILKDNSYYIFAAATILLFIFVFVKFAKTKICVHDEGILIISIFYFILAYAIRRVKSRIASVLALIGFGYAVISRLATLEIGGTFIFSLIFFAASYRCVKASFFINKPEKQAQPPIK